MKRLENLLLKACGYTLLITTLFFIVALIGKYTTAAVDFSTFALLFTFGVIISAAELILHVKSLKTVYRIMIHYPVMLASFFFVFILAGKIRTGGSSAIFSAVIVFTFLYALIFTVTYLIKKIIKRADTAIDKKAEKNRKKTAKTYTPLYKDKG